MAAPVSDWAASSTDPETSRRHALPCNHAANGTACTSDWQSTVVHHASCHTSRTWWPRPQGMPAQLNANGHRAPAGDGIWLAQCNLADTFNCRRHPESASHCGKVIPQLRMRCKRTTVLAHIFSVLFCTVVSLSMSSQSPICVVPPLQLPPLDSKLQEDAPPPKKWPLLLACLFFGFYAALARAFRCTPKQSMSDPVLQQRMHCYPVEL